MQKDTSGQRNATPRGNRPYDVSHSFVRKVASRVSGLFGGLFSTPDKDDDPVESRLSSRNNESSDTQLCSNNSVNPVASPAPYEAFRNHLANNRLPEPVAGTSGIQQAFVRHDNATHLDENPLLTPGPSGIKRRLGEATDQSRLRLDEAVRAGPSGLTSKHSYGKEEERLIGSRGSKFPRYEPVDKTNLRDDHSESSESTSGCSSLVPQADRLSQSAMVASSRRKPMALDEKLNYARQLKQSRTSLYLNRSIPIHAESPRPSRTPSFDVSAYGKPILNKSVRENMLSSPFYTGQTTYGGASATRRSSLSVHPSPRNIGSQIAVKPANEEREGANMSQTARRILSALEELSTPLNDAKRIPTPVPPLAAKRRNIEVHSAGSVAKRPALEVPTVADMLKLKRLEEIQDSTTMARKVTVAAREPSPPRWSGKIVTKQKDRGKPVSEPAPPPSELPKVPLQVTSLPKFDLPLAGMTTTNPLIVWDTPPVPAATPKPTYSFASPSDMPSDWKTKRSSLGNDFAFSTPPKLSEYLKPKSLASLTPDAFSKLKRKAEEKIEVTAVSPVKELATGSVMDILGKNSPVEKSKESNGPKTAPMGFGDQFKKAAGSWSCSTCLVNNSATADKCIACETPKAGEAKPKDNPPLCLGYFGDKFKPAAGSWSCDSCLVSNTAEAKKCVACETVKPGSDKPVQKVDGFGDKFKPASGSWTCDTCMVSNTATATKCVACESMKPGAATSNGPKTKTDEASQPNGPLSTETKPSFSFGLPPTNCTIKFGLDKAGESAVNGPKKEPGQPFSVTTSSGTFSFGIPPTSKSSVSDEPDTSTPKEIKIVSEPDKPQFSFGIVATTETPPTKPAFSASPAQPFSLNGPAFSSAPTEIKSFAVPATATPAFNISTPSVTPNLTSIAETKPEKPASAPFSFGASPAAPSNVFKFGKTGDDNKKSEVFRFGTTNLLSQPKTSEAVPAFPAFGSVFSGTENTTPHVAPNAFSFAKPTTAETGFGQRAAAPPMYDPMAFGGRDPGPAFQAAAAFRAAASQLSTFGASSFASNPFGAASAPTFGLPARTAPYPSAASAIPNYAAPAQSAFGQTSTPAFPAAASSPFQFSAGTTSNFGPSGSSISLSMPPSASPVSLSMPPSFQFNMGQAPAPERRPIIRAKRRSHK